MKRNLFFFILILTISLIIMEVISNKVGKNDPLIDKKLVDSLFRDTTFKNNLGELKSYMIDYQYLYNSDSILEYRLKIQGEKRDTLLEGIAHKKKDNWQLNN